MPKTSRRLFPKFNKYGNYGDYRLTVLETDIKDKSRWEMESG
jgi:hypothetical protein